MEAQPQSQAAPKVGILILNYHQPEATIRCVQRLLEIEPPDTVILWIENDTRNTREGLFSRLDQAPFTYEIINPDGEALPSSSQIGLILIEDNLGYAAGNNIGLRMLQRFGVEFAWIMNNDTLVTEGSSRRLVDAAEARPEVALWGMKVHDLDQPVYLGLRIQQENFAVTRLSELSELERSPMSFVNGCAMFMRTSQACAIGGIPEQYFMYYEDQAFTWEFRLRGRCISAVETVDVLHLQSLSTGHRSRFVEYYCRRNRWLFIQTYFPSQLLRQKCIFFTYQMQKLIFRLRFDRIRLEWAAYLDFRNGRLHRTTRTL